jgi:hypothetical protein
VARASESPANRGMGLLVGSAVAMAAAAVFFLVRPAPAPSPAVPPFSPVERRALPPLSDADRALLVAAVEVVLDPERSLVDLEIRQQASVQRMSLAEGVWPALHPSLRLAEGMVDLGHARKRILDRPQLLEAAFAYLAWVKLGEREEAHRALKAAQAVLAAESKR